ncbi:MAG: PEP-CTERM sorting domain-containing protein [Candidatus Acidiferrales bacterium]
MKALSRAYWVLPLVLLVFSPAHAGSIPGTVYFSGNYAFANNGYGIPPYQGALNGKSALFYCVDFSHEIYGDTSWNVNVMNLNSPSGDFASTRLGNKTIYLEMAWLITQMKSTTNQNAQAQLQWAIWSFSGGHSPYSDNDALMGDALAAVLGGFRGNGWEVLTPTGDYGQEFLVDPPTATPEPSSMVLFGTVLLGLSFVVRKKWPARSSESNLPPAA